MINIYVDAVGLAGPGLPNWQESQPTLRGEKALQETPLQSYKPRRLPANEARRTTQLVRLAFCVCEDMAARTTIDLSQCSSVFASSGGDYSIIDRICRALKEPDRPVSPTQFHNSVHNAAAGYWSIATGCHQASTSVSAYDDTFAAGLLEAAAHCQHEQLPVIFAVYDVCPPAILQQQRTILEPFGAAFLLTPTHSEASLAKLTLAPSNAETPSTAPTNPQLQTLIDANPAARSLPLLERLAGSGPAQLQIRCTNAPSLAIELQLCA